MSDKSVLLTTTEQKWSRNVFHSENSPLNLFWEVTEWPLRRRTMKCWSPRSPQEGRCPVASAADPPCNPRPRKIFPCRSKIVVRRNIFPSLGTPMWIPRWVERVSARIVRRMFSPASFVAERWRQLIWFCQCSWNSLERARSSTS